MSGAPYRFGIRMEGTTERFTELFLDRARACVAASRPFSFFELGTAEGFTFSALCKTLVANGLNRDATMVSCDLPPGQSWSTDSAKLMANMRETGMAWAEMGGTDVLARLDLAPPIGPGYATVVYYDGRTLIKALHEKLGFSPDFTFIDGCHGAPCVTRDFLAIEPTVKPGALVVFHDACLDSQHTDMQDHCHERINVRQALINLGLMPGGGRAGWAFVEEIASDRARGGQGNGHVVITRTAS